MNTSKFISPAPEGNSHSFSEVVCRAGRAESMRHLPGPSEETELLIYVWQRRTSGAQNKKVSAAAPGVSETGAAAPNQAETHETFACQT